MKSYNSTQGFYRKDTEMEAWMIILMFVLGAYFLAGLVLAVANPAINRCECSDGSNMHMGLPHIAGYSRKAFLVCGPVIMAREGFMRFGHWIMVPGL